MNQRRFAATVAFWLVAAAVVVLLAPAAALDPPDPVPDPAAAAGGGGRSGAACKPPCVIGVGPLENGKIALQQRVVVGESFAVAVAGLDAWIEGAGRKWTDARLVLNDREVEGLEPMEWKSELQALVFNLGGEFERDESQAELVNSNRQPPPQPPRSKGFLTDVLSTGGDITFHRFQMFVWTLALGGIFIVRVIYRLEMPDFDATLLGLMGISNGTFLGMKIPEGSK